MLRATKVRRRPLRGGPYRIRLARRGDIHLLPHLERAASRRFIDHGYAALIAVIPPSNETLERRQSQGRIWVAAEARDQPVGFATASIRAGVAHLDDLHVLPEHGGRGLGTELIDAVCVWAWRSASPAMTLSTLSNVPWNAPFYARRGFRVLEQSEWSDSLSDLRELECRAGLPMQMRVMMRREF